MIGQPRFHRGRDGQRLEDAAEAVRRIGRATMHFMFGASHDPPFGPLVKAFCAERGLLAGLPEVVELVRTHFDLAAPLVLTRQSDPDTGEEWIEIAADANGTVEQLIDAHHDFLRQFRSVMSPETRKNVRLYLTSADD